LAGKNNARSPIAISAWIYDKIPAYVHRFLEVHPMTITLHADPVPLRVDDSGAIRVGESRVTLDALLQYWHLGMKPAEIAKGLDTLALADVHGALGYYYRHQQELDEYLRCRGEEAEELRLQIESANASRLDSLKARVDAVKAKAKGGHDSPAI
jgi:uncharacterized protein (DUF433 family)